MLSTVGNNASRNPDKRQAKHINIMKSWIEEIGGSEFKIMRLSEGETDAPILDNPETLERYLRDNLAKSVIYSPDVENLIVVHLNTRKRAIGFEVISQGTLDTILVAPRNVFRAAIMMNSAAICLAHNHPSGDSTPSEADAKVTRDLVRGGQILKIEVIDHIVLGRPSAAQPKGYSSLRDLGYFYA